MAAPEKEPRAPRARMTGTERRHQLIDIARSLFAERGYHDAKVEDIVAVAQVAKGTFYLYFSSKEEIFLALAEAKLKNWVAIARAAGFELTWQDIDALSRVTPLLTRLYPNGEADVNDFDRAGGTAFLFRELLAVGLMHDDVETVMGRGMGHYTRALSGMKDEESGSLAYEPASAVSGDLTVLRPAGEPFSREGGLRVLAGNLGEAVVKVSAVAPEHRVITAPAHVFDTQADVIAAFKANRFERDAVVVVRFQGPRANGMPELHKLTPPLAVLQGKGFKVALVTDGRMSGASGKVPAAIHVSPEALAGGPLARVQDGDLIRLDATAGTLQALVPEAEWAARTPATLAAAEAEVNAHDLGRELFGGLRRNVRSAEEGAITWL